MTYSSRQRQEEDGTHNTMGTWQAMSELKTMTKAAESRAAALQAEKRALQTQLLAVLHLPFDFKAGQPSELKAVMDSLRALQADTGAGVVSLQAELDARAGQVQKDREVIKELESKLTTAESRVAALEAELEAKAEQARKTAKVIAELETRVVAFKSTVVELQATETNLKSELEQRKQDIHGIWERQQHQEAAVFVEMAKIKETNDSREEDLEQQKEKIKGLQEEKDSLLEQLQKLQQQQGGVEADKITGLQDEKASLLEQLQKLQQQQGGVEEKIKGLQEENASLLEQLQKLQQQQGGVEAHEIKGLQDEKASLLEQLQKLQQQQGGMEALHNGVEWQYLEGDRWNSMQPDASVQLLQAYKRYLADRLEESTVLNFGDREYSVNFSGMVQTNCRTQTQRHIRLYCQVPACWSLGPEEVLRERSSKDVWVPERDVEVWHAVEQLLRNTAHGQGVRRRPTSNCCAVRHAVLEGLWRIENFQLLQRYRDHLRRMALEKDDVIERGTRLEVLENTPLFYRTSSENNWPVMQWAAKGTILQAHGPTTRVGTWDVVYASDPGAPPHSSIGLLKRSCVRIHSGISPSYGSLDEDNVEDAKILSAHFQLENEEQANVNVAWLFHGTTMGNLSQISQEGFDFRLANAGYYGHGTYFASQSCKSHQYTCANGRNPREGHWMILARVALGCPHYIAAVDNNLRRPPLRGYGPKLYDSVVANPGFMPGHHQLEQTHQECVIFEASQAYPYLALKYRV